MSCTASDADLPTACPEEATIRHSVEQIRAKIAAAAAKAGRAADEIRLLPVTKTVSAPRLRAAYVSGIQQMGENRVQELKEKAQQLHELNISWVMIGHLQTNKVKDVLPFITEFQALDSLHLAAALDKHLQAIGKSLKVLVQVNTSGEASKFGLAPAQLPTFLCQLRAYTALRPCGLMTIAAHSSNKTEISACFERLRSLRDHALAAGTLCAGELSMGMSGDYELAIAQGATCVRLGTAIFGSRPA